MKYYLSVLVNDREMTLSILIKCNLYVLSNRSEICLTQSLFKKMFKAWISLFKGNSFE